MQKSVILFLLTLLYHSAFSIQLFGHRGASDLAPENTLSAIKWAFKLGADGVEFDVQRTRDGKLVLLHDTTLERTARYTRQTAKYMTHQKFLKIVRTPIHLLSYEQVRHIDVGLWKGKRWQGEKIPLLDDVWEHIPEGKKALLEVKEGDSEVIPLLAHTLGQSNFPIQQLYLIGFDIHLMKKVKEALPEYKVFPIKEEFSFDDPKGEMDLVNSGSFAGIDFEVSPYLGQDVVETLHHHRKEVITWVYKKKGTDSVEMLEMMQKRGVDIFTTDLPPSIIKWIREHKNH